MFALHYGLKNLKFRERLIDQRASPEPPLEALFEYEWRALDTPLRIGLERVGRYYDGDLSGKVDPIISECQQNYGILVTRWIPGRLGPRSVLATTNKPDSQTLSAGMS